MNDSGDNAPARRRSESDWLLSRIDYERSVKVPYDSGSLKLDRMRELLARLEHPERSLKIVHVAGTKGKGSTSALIASVLTAAGYRTGLYSSPHLDRIEERIVVDGQPCPEARFADTAARVRAAVEAMDISGQAEPPSARQRCSRGRDFGEPGPTFFEITTAMAICHFADQQVDAAVLEVGLGGRLDSTNVCLPRVSVITNISYDHTAQLGHTLQAIAREKAGIIKRGVPVVSGVTRKSPRLVIRQVARREVCRLVEMNRDFAFRYEPPRDVNGSGAWGIVDYRCQVPGFEDEYLGLKLPLLGRHQGANAAVALAALGQLRGQGWEISEQAVRHGVAHTVLPARVEIVRHRPTVIVDSAHNVASAEALVQVLNESFLSRRRMLILAVSRDKDIRGMLRVLGPHFDPIIATRFHHNPRALPAESLAAMVREVTGRSCRAYDHPFEAWRHARELAAPEDLIAISGSFYLAAEMRGELLRSSGTGRASGTKDRVAHDSRSAEIVEPLLEAR